MKTLRGKKLDEQLVLEIEDMLEKGFKLAPISRSTIQRRLNLKSRGTLCSKKRATLISDARKLQMKNAGLNENGSKKRNGLKEQNEILKLKIIDLEKQRDSLVEKMAMIINGAQAKGYDVEEIMMPLIKY